MRRTLVTLERKAWVGSVVRSNIDSRVWVAVVPDVDTRDGAMGASTSLRRCKEHVEQMLARSGIGPAHWVRSATDDEWDAYA